MTTLQKTLITAALITTVGAGIYEMRVAKQLKAQIRSLQLQQAPAAEQIAQLRQERDRLINLLSSLQEELVKANTNHSELLKLRGKIGRLQTAANSEYAQDVEFVVRNINLLKNYFNQNPKARTAALQFLNNQDWINIASSAELGVGGADQDKVFRHSASQLRSIADTVVGNMFDDAVQAYENNNNGQFPSEINQLGPYLKRSANRSNSDAPIEEIDAILNQWEIVPASQVKGMIAGGDMVITQKTPVDDLLDQRVVVGNKGVISQSFVVTDTYDILAPVRAAYQAANGAYERNSSELLPYATTPAQNAAIQKIIQSETWSPFASQ